MESTLCIKYFSYYKANFYNHYYCQNYKPKNSISTWDPDKKICPKKSSGSSDSTPLQWPGASWPGLRTMTSPSTRRAQGKLTIMPWKQKKKFIWPYFYYNRKCYRKASTLQILYFQNK